MPRSGPSQADQQLLAAAAAEGRPVSYAQLERWRAMALVPRNLRRGAGRGRGSVSVVPDGALDKLLAVAAEAGQGKKLLMGDPLMRAATARTFRPGAVKSAVTAVFDDACVQLGADLDGHLGSDLAGDARIVAAERATARGGWPPPRHLAEYVATGIEPPEIPAPRRAMATVLQSLASGGRDVSLDDMTAAAARLGQTRDTGDPDINAIWARLEARGRVPGWMAGEPAEAQQDDADFDTDLERALANWSLPAMRDRVHAVAEIDLVAAIRAVMIVESLQGMITLFGLPRLAGQPDVVPPVLGHFASVGGAQAMVSDPMFKLWTHNWPFANGSRSWLRFLAWAAGLAVILGMVEELGAYADRLMSVLYPDGAPTVMENLIAIKEHAATVTHESH